MQFIDTTYSIPYLILLLAYFALAVVEQRGRDNPAVLPRVMAACAAVYVLFFGFRGFIGWDWTNYYQWYHDTPGLFKLRPGAFGTEPGFVVLMSAFRQLSLGYHVFVLVNSVVHVWLLSLFLKRYAPEGFHAFGFVVFFAMGGFGLEVDTLRNCMSIMFFLVSIRYVEERRPLPFFLLNLAGCLFHLSSALYLPLYFFLHRAMPRTAAMAIFAVGAAVFFLRIEFLLPVMKFIAGIAGGKLRFMIEVYLDNPVFGNSYGISIGLIERLGSAALLILYYPQLLRAGRRNAIFINLFICYFISFFFFSEFSIISIRVGLLFACAYWILWPSIIAVSELRVNRMVLIAAMMLYFNFKMVGLTKFPLYRYDNVLTGAKSYAERREIFDRYSQRILNR